jgi:hypothetical protein
LSRDQTLAWNSEWSYTDCVTIEQHLDRVGAETFYVPPSGGYVGCVDGDGTKVLFLHPGYLEFKRELAPEDRPEPEWPGIVLSTFRPHASPAHERDDETETCTTCWTAKSLSGACLCS